MATKPLIRRMQKRYANTRCRYGCRLATERDYRDKKPFCAGQRYKNLVGLARITAQWSAMLPKILRYLA